jgi:hypothetical protein
MRRQGGIVFLLGTLVVTSCSGPDSRPAAGTASPASKIPIGELPEIDIDEVLAHTKVLSSDEYGGRGPGTKGEELTVTYLTDQFKKMGCRIR